LPFTLVRLPDAAFQVLAGNDSFNVAVGDSTGLPGEPPPVSVKVSRWDAAGDGRTAASPGAWLFPLPRSADETRRLVRPYTEQQCKLVCPDSKNPRLGIRGPYWDRAFPSSKRDV